MKRIALKLKDRYYELAKFEQKFTCNDPCNNFIKVSTKTTSPSPDGKVKIDDREYTLHPSKTHLNTKTRKGVRLNDGHNPPRHNRSYTDIYSEIGYENFTGSLLVIYQCSFQAGFLSKPFGTQLSNTDLLLSLDIEFDDPFWFGIIFTKNGKDEIKETLMNKTISEFQILESEYGSIVLAVRKLLPEWEKYKLHKDRSALGHYTEHESFHLNNE